MSKKYLIGNWKIELNKKESVLLIKKIINFLQQQPQTLDNKKIIIAPAIINLATIFSLIRKKQVVLAGQDMSGVVAGAYTGECSVSDLRSNGCQYVLLGHSERRLYHGEQDSDLVNKINLAIQQKLIPIVCIGESLADKKNGKSSESINKQLSTIFPATKELNKQQILLVYEPLWTIGQKEPLAINEVEKSILLIRNIIKKPKFSHLQKSRLSVLYGGSVRADSADQYWESSLIDGLLVGRASCNWLSWQKLIKL